MTTNGDTAEGTFTALADAVRVVRDWERTARDENADLRDRYEARLRAEGAAEMLAQVKSALTR